jgi:uncharacterized protein YeeX (DUF496 family)
MCSIQWYSKLDGRKLWLFLLLPAVMVGCKEKVTPPEEEPIARVYEQYLYPSDVAGLTTDAVTPEDSTAIVREFIDNWIRHNLLVKVATTNLSREVVDIEKQAKDYKESLLIYAYERQWLAQNLDTLISVDTIRAYWENNREDFRLKTDVYKLSYAIMPLEMSGYDTLRNLFRKGVADNRNDLEVFCLDHCAGYAFESQVWLDENNLFRLLPLGMYEGGKLRGAAVSEFEDEKNRYIVTVHEYILAGNYSPYDYVAEDIRKIIINKKKLALLKSNYNRMYTDAMQHNNAQIYEPNQ